LLDATEQVNVSAKQKIKALKTTIKQERKAKDTVKDVLATITKYLDKKAYHYCNKA
jgi:hypothetical protein